VKLDALLERARQASAYRNTLLHSAWGTGLDGDVVRRDETHEFVAIPTIKELEEFIEIIQKLILDIVDAQKAGFIHDAMAKRRVKAKDEK